MPTPTQSLSPRTSTQNAFTCAWRNLTRDMRSLRRAIVNMKTETVVLLGSAATTAVSGAIVGGRTGIAMDAAAAAMVIVAAVRSKMRDRNVVTFGRVRRRQIVLNANGIVPFVAVGIAAISGIVAVNAYQKNHPHPAEATAPVPVLSPKTPIAKAEGLQP